MWRHHPFLTNSTEPVDQADITHRQHAIIETVHSDLIDGPMSDMPSGHFAANSAWLTCAAICHNLLRAAGTITATHHVAARLEVDSARNLKGNGALVFGAHKQLSIFGIDA